MMKIPLFPLGVVLLPGMAMPLHIFEVRYRLMVAECLKTNKPFGIVYYDGKAMHSAGCLARIGEVVKRFEDGRMDILVWGEQRFVVRELMENKPYTEALVTLFEDIPSPPKEDMHQIVATATGLLHQLSGAEHLADAVSGLDITELSFGLASLPAFTHEEKQRFLEVKSGPERLRGAVTALSKIIERSRLTKEIHKIIGGNGHLPPHLLEQL